MQAVSKILHWVAFLLFLGLLMTAVAANLLFSKEAIMESFAFSLPAIGVDIAPSDQLFIARVARRFTWGIHFWLGVLFAAAILSRFLIFLRRGGRGRRLHMATFTIVSLIFLSGLPLYLRIYFDISAPVQQVARWSHFVMVWVLGLFLLWHVAWVIYRENSSGAGIVSRMLQFRAGMLLWITGALLGYGVPMHANDWKSDPDYLRGVAYMEGKIGVREGSKTIKNCPYAKCDEVADRVEKNIKTITYKTKNYPRMVAHFRKSLEKGNPLAAKWLAKFLIGRIDYRSKVPDPLLIEIGERDTGMRYEEYLALAQKSLRMAARSGDCYSMYKLAEFLRQGWMGFAKDAASAKRYYRRIIGSCDAKSFFSIMSRSRITP